MHSFSDHAVNTREAKVLRGAIEQQPDVEVSTASTDTRDALRQSLSSKRGIDWKQVVCLWLEMFAIADCVLQHWHSRFSYPCLFT